MGTKRQRDEKQRRRQAHASGEDKAKRLAEQEAKTTGRKSVAEDASTK